jgi:hypothetical protein
MERERTPNSPSTDNTIENNENRREQTNLTTILDWTIVHKLDRLRIAVNYDFNTVVIILLRRFIVLILGVVGHGGVVTGEGEGGRRKEGIRGSGLSDRGSRR